MGKPGSYSNNPMTHFWFFLLNALMMMALPFVLGHFLGKRVRLDWGLFGVGAITFVLSQVGHIPFNQFVLARLPALSSNLLTIALFAGLSAGIFEEGARFLMYRFWVPRARDWRSGLMLGLGHGGIESFLTGLLVAINGYVLFTVREGATSALVPAAQLPAVQQILADILAASPFALLLGAVERLFAICLHLTLSLLVLQVFCRQQGRWLLFAIGGHAAFNAVAVYAAATWNAYVAELLIGLMAAGGVFLIWRLCLAEQAAVKLLTEPEPLLEDHPVTIRPVDLTTEKLDNSRFQ